MKRFRPRVQLFAALHDIGVVKTFSTSGFFGSDIFDHQRLGNAHPYGYDNKASTIGLF